ncbi:hypothetical protein PCANC_24430 [Puccinia coronata f. sp. avenae]|uniref:Uncharacterized protein n=1 Tax=Puccinia coronata f. sp. avenae TaxID=200324 RepID=A0A2N5TR84_9BASI|nr:hypothetical protein PCANC_24430 [Puccinia coronata f. sp. avenae]
MQARPALLLTIAIQRIETNYKAYLLKSAWPNSSSVGARSILRKAGEYSPPTCTTLAFHSLHKSSLYDLNPGHTTLPLLSVSTPNHSSDIAF